MESVIGRASVPQECTFSWNAASVEWTVEQRSQTRSTGLLTFPKQARPFSIHLCFPILGLLPDVLFPLSYPGHFLSSFKDHLKSQLPFKAFPNSPHPHPEGFLQSPRTFYPSSFSVIAPLCVLVIYSPVCLLCQMDLPKGRDYILFNFVDSGPGTQALERCVWNVMRC